MHKREKKGLLPLIFITLAVLVSSCVSVSKLKYFNDIDEVTEPVTNPREMKLIMPFDKISVSIFSIEEKSNQLFNSTTSLGQGANEYLVDETGCINFPLTGRIEVKGLNIQDAGSKIAKVLSEYISVASVIVKFVENNVTLLGEVQTPGTFQVAKDKLNIYEALALGGGISQYGDHKKVILVRQEGDKIMYHKLDLSTSRITSSNFYYIQPNDVIVVEPINKTSWYRFNSGNVTTAFSMLSTLLSIYIMITRL